MDHLYTLNDETPKIKCQGNNGIDPDLIFGGESKLFLATGPELGAIHDEVETLTVYRGGTLPQHAHAYSEGAHVPDLERPPITKGALEDALQMLPRESIWRTKGFVQLSDGTWAIVNWAFGRYELQEYSGGGVAGSVRLTIMGSRGAVRGVATRFAGALGSLVSH